MKILILSSIFPPNIFGGAEIAAHSLACLLSRRGHEVSVATFKEKAESEVWGDLQPGGYRLYKVMTIRSYTIFSRTKQSGVFNKVLWHLMDLFDFRNKSIVDALVKEINPDCIDVHNIVGFGFNSLSGVSNKDIPIKFFLHDFGLACFHASMFKNGRNCGNICFKCKFVGFFRQRSLDKLKNISFVAPSKIPFEKMDAHVPLLKNRPRAVLKNAAERLDFEVLDTDVAVTRLVFVGRLDPVKGIEFLLRILSGISDKFDFVIDVLGTGPLENKLKKIYSAAKWCRFHGFVSSKVVSSYISSADLFCMPSQWSEVYGLVTAQALQFGIPVIGSNIGGTKELVRDGVTGVLVDPTDECAWTESLSVLLSDKIQLDLLRKGARDFIDDFSDDVIGNEYDKISNCYGLL